MVGDIFNWLVLSEQQTKITVTKRDKNQKTILKFASLEALNVWHHCFTNDLND